MTSLDESAVAAFLRAVGTGRMPDVRATLASAPQIVNAVGPHPFWGGRPQPLHVAIETKRRDMFDVLLEHGADVNGTNDQYDDWSPLMLAINRKRADMVDELRTRGARIGLVEALMLGDDEHTDALLQTSGATAMSPNRGSILAFARTPFAIDRLLALGARADIADRWGSTPVEGISRLGPAAAPLIAHLVQRGVRVTPADRARVGDREGVARLIEEDPSVAKTDAVMMAAVDFGHVEIVKLLLQAGANVNARADAPSRHTALHSAAWNGDMEMVRLLIDAGADVHARDEQYDAPPLGWADTSIEVSNNPKCAEVVELLKTQGA